MSRMFQVFILSGILSLYFVCQNVVFAQQPPNRPPVLEPIGNKTIEVAAELIFIVFAEDPDGDPISYTLSRLPQGAIYKEFRGVGKIYYIFRWTPTYAQRGTYSITFFAEDSRGGVDLETIDIVIKEAVSDKDVVAPFISDVAIVDRSGNSATISWSTNEPALGKIEYGTSSNYGETSDFTTDFSLTSRKTIKNLKPGTLYRYKIAAKDKAGNLSFSAERSFSTVTLEEITGAELRFRIANTKLARVDGDPRAYYITSKNFKKWIRNEEIFRSYKSNKWENIVVAPKGSLDVYPDVELIRRGEDKRVYKLEGDAKRWIKTPAAFARLGYNWDNILSINDTEFNFYTEGLSIE